MLGLSGSQSPQARTLLLPPSRWQGILWPKGPPIQLGVHLSPQSSARNTNVSGKDPNKDVYQNVHWSIQICLVNVGMSSSCESQHGSLYVHSCLEEALQVGSGWHAQGEGTIFMRHSPQNNGNVASPLQITLRYRSNFAAPPT